MNDEFLVAMEDHGVNARDLWKLGEAKNPTALENLYHIERGFTETELLGKMLMFHQGKLLAQARKIFDAHYPEGEADKLYGRWRAEKLGISQRSAHRSVAYFEFCSKSINGRPSGLPLPTRTVVEAITAKTTPDTIRRKFTNQIKEGEPVTEKMVRQAVAAATKKKARPKALELPAALVAQVLKLPDELLAQVIELAQRELSSRKENK